MIPASLHNIHSTNQYRLAGSHTDYSDADVARFFAKVGEPTETGCWLWLASSMDACGHGQFTLRRDGKQFHLYAHRVSWELNRGPIPAGQSVLHNCPGGDNPKCVNPAHLFLGTQVDNLADARRKGRLNEKLPRTGKAFTFAERQAIFDMPHRHGLVTRLAQQHGVSKACISKIRHGEFARMPVADAPQQKPNLTLEPVRSIQLVVRGEVR